jgi:AcrR family transcriptional regulator
VIDESGELPQNRFQRRKLRTRAALIGAAQSFIAAGQLSVPILDITRAADVGMGSFYNHFATKYAVLLDMLTVSIEDPVHSRPQFRDATGMSVLDWITRGRVNQAKVLVETTDFRLAEIAAMVGFGSAETLRRNFEKITGVTAGDYRITFKSTPQSIAS